jgi:hypothetical protein
MKCVFCSNHSFGYTFSNDVLVCFFCIIKIKKGALDVFAPNPFQDKLLTEGK